MFCCFMNLLVYIFEFFYILILGVRPYSHFALWLNTLGNFPFSVLYLPVKSSSTNILGIIGQDTYIAVTSILTALAPAQKYCLC